MITAIADFIFCGTCEPERYGDPFNYSGYYEKLKNVDNRVSVESTPLSEAW